MAPGAQVIAFTGADNTHTAILSNITDHDDVKQISASWIWKDGTIGDLELLLELAS